MYLLKITELSALAMLLGTSFVSNAEHVSKQLTSNLSQHCSLSEDGEILCWSDDCKKPSPVVLGHNGSIKEISLEKERICAITGSSTKSFANCYVLEKSVENGKCDYQASQVTRLSELNMKTEETLLDMSDDVGRGVYYKSPSNHYKNLKSYTHKSGRSITCFIVTEDAGDNAGELWCNGSFKESLKFSSTFPVLSDYYTFPGNNDYRSYHADKWYYSTNLVMNNVEDYIVSTQDICVLTKEKAIKCLEYDKNTDHFSFRNIEEGMTFSEVKIARLDQYKYLHESNANVKRKRYLLMLNAEGKVTALNNRYVVPLNIINKQYKELALTAKHACAARKNSTTVDCWKRTAREESSVKTYELEGKVEELTSSSEKICATVSNEFSREVHCLTPMEKSYLVIGPKASNLAEELYDVWLNRAESKLAIKIFGTRMMYRDDLVVEDFEKLAGRMQLLGLNLEIRVDSKGTDSLYKSLKRLPSLKTVNIVLDTTHFPRISLEEHLYYRRLTLEEIRDLDFKKSRKTIKIKSKSLTNKSMDFKSFAPKSFGILEGDRGANLPQFPFPICDPTFCDPVGPTIDDPIFGPRVNNPRFPVTPVIPGCDPRICDPAGPDVGGPTWPVGPIGPIDDICDKFWCGDRDIRVPPTTTTRETKKYYWSFSGLSELNSLENLTLRFNNRGAKTIVDIDFNLLSEMKSLKTLSVGFEEKVTVKGVESGLARELAETSIRSLVLGTGFNCTNFINNIEGGNQLSSISLYGCLPSFAGFDINTGEAAKVNEVILDFSNLKHLRSFSFSKVSNYALHSTGVASGLFGTTLPIVIKDMVNAERIEVFSVKGNFKLLEKAYKSLSGVQRLRLENQTVDNYDFLLELNNLEKLSVNKYIYSKLESIKNELVEKGVEIKNISTQKGEL